jgi:hypothetical protein
MKKSICIVLLAAAAVVSGCANGPAAGAHSTAQAPRWNDGLWNSVLGYQGPVNTMASEVGGP